MTGPKTKKPDPWSRQPGEKALWYGRFIVFRNLGSERTIEEAYRKTTGGAKGRDGKPIRPARHWYYAAERHRWRERAIAWDDSILTTREPEARRSQARVLADEWDIYEKGLEKLKQFLALPLVKSTMTQERTSEDGTAIFQTIEVSPMLGVTMSSLASLMQAVDSIGRRAAGLSDLEKASSSRLEDILEASDEELAEMIEEGFSAIERRRGLRLVSGGR